MIEFVDHRPFIRDYYANRFHKGGALDYIALQDFDMGYMIIGRIQVIEYLAWDIWPMPKDSPFKDKAEVHYFQWLQSNEFKELFDAAK